MKTKHLLSDIRYFRNMKSLYISEIPLIKILNLLSYYESWRTGQAGVLFEVLGQKYSS